MEFKVIRDKKPVVLTEFEFGDLKNFDLLNTKKEKLQNVLNALIDSKGLNDESVLFVSQELDKVIVELTKIMNGLVTDEEFDLYIKFCKIYNIMSISRKRITKAIIENTMLHVLTNKK